MSEHIASLPRKHRPKTLEQMIGNKNVIVSLETILERKTGIPASFLLYGPSGCGKTTLARIIASMLGASGSDLKQMNVSDKGGVDDARAIIKSCLYGSFSGKRTVIILNECHRSSKNFQDAMLDITEEPREGLHFIFVTTEPQSLLVTLRGRCTEFKVQTLSKRKMKELIGTVLEAERAAEDFPEEAIEKIIKVADGVPREALKLLDAVIDIPNNDDLINAIDRFVVSEAVIKELCQALLQKLRWGIVANILKTLPEDPETIRRSVLRYMTAVLLNSGKPEAALIIEIFKDNFYDSGKAGLTVACFEVISG